MAHATRISRQGVERQLVYFTSTSLLEGDRELVMIGDTPGGPNLFCMDVATGQERQLTFQQEGVLKSYVYFDGTPHRGFGKGSVSVDAQRGVIYFIQGRSICAVDLAGRQRVVAELPAGQMTAFTHVSADGKLLCVPTVDARALDGDALLPGKPSYDIDQRVREENLSSYLRVYDTGTGRELMAEQVQGAWVTHVQFSPVDSGLILYNHEWPSDCGVRRMWLWDGSRHVRLRTEGDGRRRGDWTCHEMWERDGSGIIYHGKYEGGASYLGRVKADGTGRSEIAMPEGFNRYGHFTVGATGVLVTDGYYEQVGDAKQHDTPANTPPAWAGEWLSVVRVDWEIRRMEWQPLCRHGSSWRSQDAHPHPIFDHAAQAIWFTSDKEGHRGVYQMRIGW